MTLPCIYPHWPFDQRTYHTALLKNKTKQTLIGFVMILIVIIGNAIDFNGTRSVVICCLLLAAYYVEWIPLRTGNGYGIHVEELMFCNGVCSGKH